MTEETFTIDPVCSTTRDLSRWVPEQFRSHSAFPAGRWRDGPRVPAAEGGLRTNGYFKSAETRGGSATMPLVTIITIVFNGGRTLEQTIQSVLAQDYARIEYLLIDGGSTDDSLDIIRRYSSSIDYWMSENDAGISDAFNRGISLCSGEFHMVLNADDWYEPDAVSKLVARLDHHPQPVIVSAKSRIVDESQNFLKIYTSVPDRLMTGMTLAHNTCLLNTEAVRSVGCYDLLKRVAMDHHLVMRLRKAYGADRIVSIDAIVSNYRMGGVSDKQARKGFLEVRDNVRAYGMSALRANAQFALAVCKHSVSSWLRRIRGAQ